MQPFNYSRSYDEFLARLRKSLQNQNISEDILALLKNGFEKTLHEQKLFFQEKKECEPIIPFQKKYWLN